MKVLRALVLSIWFYSLLLWLYIVLRITIDGVILSHRFIDEVPYFTFASLGIISFAISFVSLFIYLVVWGIPGEAKLK